MEHIVQFGITIDDQAIKDRIEHKEALAQITEEMINE